MENTMDYGDDLTEEQLEMRRKDRLASFGGGLVRLAEQRVSQRAEVERRWLEDIYQYNGRYDPGTQALLDADPNASKVFINITRPKVNTVVARLTDMLFPTDDKNWGLKHTPVPDVDGADGEEANAIASDRCDAMAEEIDDQLKEARYNIKSRDALHQGVLLGTGVLKGPVIIGQDRRRWENLGAAEDGQDMYGLTYSEDKRPSVEAVDVWNFFPDMSVPDVVNGESTLERHYLTRRQVRNLLKRPGFDVDAVKSLLKMDPKEYRSTSSHLEDLRAIAGLSSMVDDKRYEIWEYHGPIESDDLVACGCEDVDPENPLDEYEGVVWFCGPTILKAIVNPMDSGEPIYSLFCWEKDDAGPFGYGVSYQLRNPQRVVNSAWRMMLTNGGLSVGPQVIVDRNLITPADNSYGLVSRKVWYFNSAAAGNRRASDAFTIVDIPSRQGDLQNILLTAMRLADEETAMPIIAQGDNAPHMPDTAQGMSMLMNNSNTVTRRSVKNFDDDVTTPMISRFYDWNMQFNKRNEIKGDYAVVARGTAALLVKEQQQQALLQLTAITTNPIVGQRFKGGPLARKTVQAMHLDADELVYTDDEFEGLQKTAAEQGGGVDPVEQMKLELNYKMHQEKLLDAQAEREARLQERLIEQQTMIARLAQEQELTIAQVKAQLDMKTLDASVKRQNFVDEANLKITAGQGI